MRSIIILLLIIFMSTIDAAITKNTDSGTWSTISQYALGVWKYYNSTTFLSTIPHS